MTTSEDATPAAAESDHGRDDDAVADVCSRFLGLDERAGRHARGLFAALRQRAGVYQEQGTGFYLVSRYQDIVQVLRDPAGFSSAHALGPEVTRMMNVAASQMAPEQLALLVAPTAMLCADGDQHARLRRLVNAAFTVAAVRRWEGTIRQTARHLLADLSGGQQDDITVEWVGEFARPLATQTMAYVLGVPPADYPQFADWNKAMVNLVNGIQITPEALTGYLTSAAEFTAYFHDQVTRLRAQPDGSLLSHLAAVPEDGDRLSDEEIVKLCLILLSAGSETTVGLITSIAVRLARDPALPAALRADPGERIPGFVEEVLRLDTPAQAMFRTATADAVIAGTPVSVGSHLLLLFASAGRDATVYADPEVLAYQRDESTGHLAFGLGVHRCLGAALARAEGRIAAEELLTSFDALRHAKPLHTLGFRPHLIGPALQELPLLMRPAPGA
jgi:cytochrome P450